MVIYRAKDYEDLSKKAASIIAAQVILQPDAILGLATGSTPVGTYQNLIAQHQAGDLDFSQVTSINLDEYKGLSGEHDQSYRYFMNTQLFDHINIDKDNTFVPNGLAEDGEEECSRYNDLIEAMGGADLQLLGIGGNGHIGFNEPDDAFTKETHLVTLAEETREANARFFESLSDVPTQAYTMGIGNILSAGKILLLASGAGKAQALYDACYGPITPRVPASILQLHPDVVVVADEAAMLVIDKNAR